MPDPTIEVTRRRVLASLITLGGAGAASGAGTMAYFTDTTQSTGNNISAGTLNLDFNSTGTFQFSTSLAPGSATKDSVTLVSDGSITGSLDVDISYGESDDSPNETNISADQVAQNLNVITLEYDESSLLGEQTLPADPTLYQLASNEQVEAGPSDDIVNLADPDAGKEFTIELELANVGNDYQSDGVEITFEFDLNQTDGQ